MSTASPLSPSVAADLVRSVDVHRAVIPARHLRLVRSICMESVASGLETDAAVGVRAMRARSAAALLLELICPWLDPTTRGDLAVVCSNAARTAR